MRYTDSFMTTFTTRTRERTLDMRAQTHTAICFTRRPFTSIPWRDCLIYSRMEIWTRSSQGSPVYSRPAKASCSSRRLAPKIRRLEHVKDRPLSRMMNVPECHTPPNLLCARDHIKGSSLSARSPLATCCGCGPLARLSRSVSERQSAWASGWVWATIRTSHKSDARDCGDELASIQRCLDRPAGPDLLTQA
jgi:hypothetical protein